MTQSSWYIDTLIALHKYISQASEELEERESLAQMAANDQETNNEDGDTYIGKLLFVVRCWGRLLSIIHDK